MPVRLLQFSDTHLFATEDGKLCGLNTQDSLRAVLLTARRRHWPVDAVLATGDLSQDVSEASYRRFQDHFEPLGVPVMCLPGNHDELAMMRRLFTGDRVRVGESAVYGAWHVVMLNTAIPGENGGRLEASELDRLSAWLGQNRERHTLVCLHHHPVPSGSAWMDTMMLENSADFFSVLRKNPQVRGVVWGHVHQEYAERQNGVLFASAPSTSVQFTPQSRDFSLDMLNPGYRWFTLHEDGRIDTGVQRAESFNAAPDVTIHGY